MSKTPSPHLLSMLMELWTIAYGIPDYMLTDKRKQFTSKCFESHFALLGSKHLTKTAYHPRQMNKLEDSIRRLSHD